MVITIGDEEKTRKKTTNKYATSTSKQEKSKQKHWKKYEFI